MKSEGYHRIDKKIKRKLLKWIGWLFSAIVVIIVLVFGLIFLISGLEIDEYIRFVFDLTKDVGVVILANVVNATVGG